MEPMHLWMNRAPLHRSSHRLLQELGRAQTGASVSSLWLLLGKDWVIPPLPLFLSAQTLPQGTLVCDPCRELFVLVHLELGGSTSS